MTKMRRMMIPSLIRSRSIINHLLDLIYFSISVSVLKAVEGEATSVTPIQQRSQSDVMYVLYLMNTSNTYYLHYITLGACSSSLL